MKNQNQILSLGNDFSCDHLTIDIFCFHLLLIPDVEIEMI